MWKHTKQHLLALVIASLFISGCGEELYLGFYDYTAYADITGSGGITQAGGADICKLNDHDYCWTRKATETTRLIPNPGDGYEFAGWGGDCLGLGYCDIYIPESYKLTPGQDPLINVTATFVPIGTLSLTNTSSNLNAVLEQGQIKGACDRYFDNIDNDQIATEYLKLMCGKSMFFYDGFELLGVPKLMVDLLLEKAPNSMGPGFSKFGLIQDPFSKEGYPLGLTSGKVMKGVPSMAFGCASCHFAQSNGLYSVGMPNHDYDYGKHIMAMTFVPAKAAGDLLFKNPISAQMNSWVAPQVSELKSNISTASLLLKMSKLTPLLEDGSGIPTPSADKQDMYLSWKKGTQDFVIDPVGLDDQVETVSKMLPLWSLPTPDSMLSHGGPASAMLGLTGSTPELDVFVQDFIVLSLGASQYDYARRQPLVDYILTLKAPENPNLANTSTINAGENLFSTKGCASCHNGPNKSSTRLYTYAEIGVDDAMMQWADKGADGNSEVPELFVNGSVITHKLKAPKLTGLWAQKLFLHNGSVNSLEALFCLTPLPSRPTIDTFGFSDKGHMMTCESDSTNPTNTMTDADKNKLIAYLLSL